jgi:putative lipoic acid-binding regulatory protein
VAETLLTFPCDVPIKVFGRNDRAFRDEALRIVRAHYPDVGVSEQPSRQGTYLSLTLTVHAASKDEIDAVYRELVASAQILMVL